MPEKNQRPSSPLSQSLLRQPPRAAIVPLIPVDYRQNTMCRHYPLLFPLTRDNQPKRPPLTAHPPENNPPLFPVHHLTPPPFRFLPFLWPPRFVETPASFSATFYFWADPGGSVRADSLLFVENVLLFITPVANYGSVV
ncbi:hypothetical protein HAX54_033394 [Datura stramonium]|uniref:Uncharacterized protein n=1 Tax=Datura stramonium TaxID=4076 RepID=A0ABS8SDE9_DATST|nr:hypothetical protein [Datura stramonium]